MDDSIKVSEDVLERLPGRALNLLSGIGKLPELRGALALRGYTHEVHNRGWKLLELAAGRALLGLPQEPEAPTQAVDEAEEAIDLWDEPNFAVARATLRHNHTAQFNFVFGDGLAASRGKGSVMGTLTFLNRLDALERAPEREATREADHAALAALTERGIDKGERARMRKLVNTVQEGVAPVVAINPKVAASRKKDPAPMSREAKMALYVWYSEWSEIVRVVTDNRAHLIRCGLAAPRKGKGAAVKPPPVKPTSPSRPSGAPQPA